MSIRHLVSVKWLHYARHSLRRALERRPRLTFKEFNELRFWRYEMRTIVAWYLGKIPQYWDIPAPANDAKISDYDLQSNAILSWAIAGLPYYPSHLSLPTDYFEGKTLLDIGCGPIPHAQAFTGCNIYNLDPLLAKYAKAGFPLDLYSPRMSFVCARAEEMPFETASIDAAISVNAIDHVDDLEAVAKEIARVLKPDGILRFEAHYHQPTVLEPLSLTDELIYRHFAPLEIKKIQERPYEELDAESDTQEGELLVIWGTSH